MAPARRHLRRTPHLGPLDLRSPHLLPLDPGGLLQHLHPHLTHQRFVHDDAEVRQGSGDLFRDAAADMATPVRAAARA